MFTAPFFALMTTTSALLMIGAIYRRSTNKAQSSLEKTPCKSRIIPIKSGIDLADLGFKRHAILKPIRISKIIKTQTTKAKNDVKFSKKASSKLIFHIKPPKNKRFSGQQLFELTRQFQLQLNPNGFSLLSPKASNDDNNLILQIDNGTSLQGNDRYQRTYESFVMTLGSCPQSQTIEIFFEITNYVVEHFAAQLFDAHHKPIPKATLKRWTRLCDLPTA